MNRQTLADRWHCAPFQIEHWPAYEVAIALRMLEIETKGNDLNPKTRKKR